MASSKDGDVGQHDHVEHRRSGSRAPSSNDGDTEAAANTGALPKDLADADLPPDATDAQRQLFASFATRDAAWVRQADKALVRKIDIHLLPLLIIIYLLNFLDRSNLAQARQGTLEEDLGMKGTDFNVATSIFFVGYLLMQLPSNVLITRVRPSFYLATSVALWGMVSTCNAATHTFGQLVATRFFLGFVEAPFFPGAVFLMSSWYTRPELTRRVAWLYMGNALANMFGGLIGYGVLENLDGAHGIAGWRWLFIIEGVATIGVAFFAAAFLPDYPATTRWLNDEERAFAAWRLLADIAETDDRYAGSLWDGVKLALSDYRLYLFTLFQHMSLLSQTFQYFFPSIVETLGYGPVTSLLLTVPAWFATLLVGILVNWTSARTNDKFIHISVLMLLGAAGNAIASATTKVGPRFFAMFLMPIGTIASYSIIVGWVANSFPRPLVKRSAAIAVANMVGNTASIYGSYMYNKKTAPQYVPGGSANACICVLTALMACFLAWVHKRENQKLEKAEREAVGDGEAEVRAAGFRYLY